MDTSKTKPDLLAADSKRGTAQGKRILAQLEHGARQQTRRAHAADWSIDGWTIGLFVLLLLMCSVAWMMHDKKITPQTFRHEYSSGASVRRVTAPAEAPAAQPAAIVNEMPAEVAAVSAPEREVKPLTDAAPPQPGRAATMMAAARKPATPAERTVAPAASAANAAKPIPQAAGDTDVTLLTALVAHASKPAAVAPERSRDIVERQDGDSTVQLLARCKQLGVIEGMLCRSRICSGRWESDAACRAPSH